MESKDVEILKGRSKKIKKVKKINPNNQLSITFNSKKILSFNKLL